ncbi:uncharacterized protein LOC123512276 isoform X2 [Portunus trituberculatus]|uniref:uncharacterized protein LOC123512276 isoform X2 n=1 Tax=Portunus trituberculatus TaxID=210409 RepID=UPI001E1CBDC4|nr:uncharacterized protein LOC123512276 isoform X2 [Portunus trituberculatus]
MPPSLPLTNPQGHYPGVDHMGHHDTPVEGATSSPWDDYYTFQLNPIRRISPGGNTDAAHVLKLRGGMGQGVGHGEGFGAGYGALPGVPAYPSPLALATLLNLKALTNPTGPPLPTLSPLYRQDRHHSQEREQREQAQPQEDREGEPPPPPSPPPPPQASPQQLQQEVERRQTMRRMITAAGFVLPVTTALLGALGAPVALMAPLGLAIPALLSTGFLDISGRSAGRGSEWRFNPSHTKMQIQKGWEAEERLGGDREALAALSHNVSAGEVLERRRRDVTEGTEGTNGMPRDSHNTTETPQTSQQDEETPRREVTRPGQDNTSSLLLLLPEEVEVLDSLTQYYQSLSILDHNGPTLEEITKHRLFLLSLLQKLTAGKTKENSLVKTTTTTTTATITTTTSKNTVLPLLQPSTLVEGRAGTTLFPTPSPRPNLHNKATNFSAPEGVAEGNKASRVNGTREASAFSSEVPSSSTEMPLPTLTPAKEKLDSDLRIREGEITALFPTHWPPPRSPTQHPPPLSQSQELTQFIYSLADEDIEAAAFLPKPKPAAPPSSRTLPQMGFMVASLLLYYNQSFSMNFSSRRLLPPSYTACLPHYYSQTSMKCTDLHLPPTASLRHYCCQTSMSYTSLRLLPPPRCTESQVLSPTSPRCQTTCFTCTAIPQRVPRRLLWCPRIMKICSSWPTPRWWRRRLFRMRLWRLRRSLWGTRHSWLNLSSTSSPI